MLAFQTQTSKHGKQNLTHTSGLAFKFEYNNHPRLYRGEQELDWK